MKKHFFFFLFFRYYLGKLFLISINGIVKVPYVILTLSQTFALHFLMIKSIKTRKEKIVRPITHFIEKKKLFVFFFFNNFLCNINQSIFVLYISFCPYFFEPENFIRYIL